MKQSVTAGVLLLLLLSLVLWHSKHLQTTFNGYISQLTAAREAADRDDWVTAEALTQQVWQSWQRQDVVFHSLLRHSEIDEIHVTMQEVFESLSLADRELYNTANTRLIMQLSLLSQMEQLTVQNIL